MTKTFALAILLCAAMFACPLPAGADDEDLHTQLMRATVKIAHDSSTATGFVLTRPNPSDPNRPQFVLITAAHVFTAMTANEATLVFRAKSPDGSFQKKPQPIVVRKDGKPAWTQHETEDVAVLVIEPAEGVDLPRVSTDLLASDESLARLRVHPGDEVACLGYPHRVEANEAGFAVLRSGPIGSYPLTPSKQNKTFLLSANSFEGDSGGPVYLADDHRRVAGSDTREDARLILGLITGQHFLDEELKTIYGSSKVRHRLGLAIVIQAAFIRETIDRLP